MNNYLEWSKEYRAEADKMLSVVDKYKSMLKTKSLLNKKEINGENLQIQRLLP